VFEPTDVIALREVLARMRAAALGAMRGGMNRGARLQQQILQLESFDEIACSR
jgi:hypothetical protein